MQLRHPEAFVEVKNLCERNEYNYHGELGFCDKTQYNAGDLRNVNGVMYLQSVGKLKQSTLNSSFGVVVVL
jgi:hypothetical protein